ncbi:MAG: DUF4159 domain-containing protein [Candidatus Auribacterota bacterium]
MRKALLFFIMFFLPAISAAQQADYDFQVARLHYDGGGDWYADPTSLPNLLKALRERIGLNAPASETVITPDDPNIFRYPFVYITGHGNINFSAYQAKNLRTYLERGGLIWADDNYGMDTSFRREILKILPQAELVELPPSHPLFQQYYQFPDGLPKIHEHDGKPPQCFGVFLDGRLAIIYTYETDIGDGLESPEVHEDPPDIREAALKMAINIVLYSLNN